MLQLMVWCAAALVAGPACSRPLTPADIHELQRITSFSISPNGHLALVTTSRYDFERERSISTSYEIDLRNRNDSPKILTRLKADSREARFGSDGAVWFLAPVSGQDQLFRYEIGRVPKQISNFEGKVAGFKISANGARAIVWAERDLRCPTFNCREFKTKANSGTGRIYEQLYVRQWDHWITPGVRNRIFSFEITDHKLVGHGIPILGRLAGDAPTKPFGGEQEIEISPDGAQVYFTLRESRGIESMSNNMDVFSAPADGSTEPVNLTAHHSGYDSQPSLSPDGTRLAWLRAQHAYEADRQILMVRHLGTGMEKAITQDWDRSVRSITWDHNSSSVIIEASDTLENPLFRVDLATGAVRRLTARGSAHSAAMLPDGSTLFLMNNVAQPDELFRLTKRGRVEQLTHLNYDKLSGIDPVQFNKFSFIGASGDRVWGVIIKPVLDAKLPVLLFIHGGPQGTYDNSWSARWNARVLSSGRYAVVGIDFHGSTGYGKSFTESIAGNWGSLPLLDLKLGLESVLKSDPQLDGNRTCALGASFGGYLVNWIAGAWADRFRCLVMHNGAFDQRAMAYETEEIWFSEWQNGGAPQFENAGAFERWNPVNKVANWKTPMLVIAGEKDYRVPYTQAVATFTALQRRSIPSKLLIFPDEGHWVVKPHNSLQWHQEIFAWLDRWLINRGPCDISDRCEK